ncbi:hypothetical protein EIP91_001892 [Steccherinum ochraceum]|uniref:Uncharacterized protein n=1 Tax=Steccherinum ochraceum TaxID=92696 RepID=A0A4R0RFL9_9APHY|nr:hypothetical protein EIP91_001892 [Steccherinum ochraceum]
MSSAFVPIRRLVGNGSILDRIRIQVRLWRIGWCIRKGSRIPSQFFQDLVEIQRSDRDFYLDVERFKAWFLLRVLADRRRTHEVAGALMMFPTHVTISFLRSLAAHDATGPSRAYSPLCSLISVLQAEEPQTFHDAFTLDSFCGLITQINYFDGLAHLGLYRFFDGIAKVTQASSQQNHDPCFTREHQGQHHLRASSPPTESFCLSEVHAHGHHSCWDLPAFAQCLVKFLVTGAERNIRRVVEHIITSIAPYTDEFPSTTATQPVIQYHPHLMKSDFHPVRPFLLFAIHLTFASDLATRILINAGILKMIGRLWVYQFRDPRGPQWREPLVQNDMHVGCLLLLGALARHYPSAREMADYLLDQLVENGSEKGLQLYVGGYGNSCHYKGLHSIAWGHCPPACAVPSSTLFMMEVCLTNGVYIVDMPQYMYGGAWSAVMRILNAHHIHPGFADIKEAATRTLFALASMPDEYWRGFTEMLCKHSMKSCESMFKFVTQDFLHATSDHSDVVALPKSTVISLQKMYIAARERGSEVANPIDRFIMLVRVRQATNRDSFSRMLVASHFPDLLRAVLEGRYDFLASDLPSIAERRTRERPYVL